MANKKVFTNLEFKGNSELLNPRLNPGSAPASTGPGQAYFDTGTGGTLNLQFAAAGAANNGTWRAVHTSGVAFTTDASVGFTADPPFTVGNTTQITNLNAHYLNGYTPSTSATNQTIPVYGTGGVLKVGTPVADDDASSKGYVDTAVQGLDHKESVKYTTTGNITLENVTPAQSNLDIGTAIVEGDRVLVKDQDDAYENGIYIAKHNDDWERADDDPSSEGVEIITNGTFAGGSESGWTSNSVTTTTVTNNQLVITSGSTSSDYGTVFWPINLTEGKKYIFKYDVVAASGHGYHRVGTTATDNVSPNTSIFANPSGVSSGSTLVMVFTATSAQASDSYISIGARDDITSLTIDNVSLKEIDEGAFVFVEEGDTKANTSFVFSDPAALISHPSSSNPSWTQFSGAGQLAVTSNGAVAAPLTKSGDTVDFRYSLDNALSTTSAVSLVDPAASVFTSGVYGWARYNSNTIDNVGSALVITHVNNSEGAYVTLRDSADLTGDLVVGKKYRLTADAFYTSGSSGSKLQVKLSGSTVDSAVLTTSSVTYTIDFTADTATGVKFHQSGMGTNNVVTIDNWNLYELDALTVSSGGIDTVHLADNAVEPAKLLETGAFTMGGLTVNGAATATGLVTASSGTNGAMQLGLASALVTGAGTYDTALRWNGSSGNMIFSAGAVERMRLTSAGKLGIGQDATSPSGTLHVSSGRYGSELVTNGTAWTGATGGTPPNSWTEGYAGTFLIDSSSGSGSEPALKISRSTTNSYIYQTFAVNTGRKYYVTFRVKNVDATRIDVALGSTAVGNDYGVTNHTSTSWTTYTLTKTATTDLFSIYVQLVTSTGTQSGYIDSVSIKEDSLASATGSTFLTANDLVVNNGAGQAGVTILGSGASNLHFGESGNSAHTRIISTYDANKDSILWFKASDNDTANTVMKLYGVDKSVKIEGGLGVGGVTAGMSGAYIAGGYTAIERATTSAQYAALYLTKTGSSGNQVLADFNYGATAGTVGSGTTAVQLAKDTSYFTGNVAIGGTTAATKLEVNTAPNSDAITLRASTASSLGQTTGIRFQYNAAVPAAIRTSMVSTNSGAADLGFFTASDGTVGNLTNRFEISSTGTQDHKANSIVNSASIQGLQDSGACYDFDGTDGYIDVGSGSGLDNLTSLTLSAWVRLDGWGEGNAGRIFSKTSTGNTGGWTVYVNSAGQVGLIDDWTTTDGNYISPVVFSLSNWTHVAVTYDRSSAGQAPTFYVNGVAITLSSTTASVGAVVSDTGSPAYIGARKNGSAIDREFEGQIRDFKIFPSVLDDDDVRKLYSGENPKKNLNVELVTNGDFGTALGSEWDDRSQGTLSLSSGQLLITGGPAYSGAQQAVTTVSGKTYVLSVERGATTGASGIQVGSASGTGANSYNLVNNHSSTLGVSNHTFVATSNPTYITLQTGPSANVTAKFDNVSVTEVSTLVDFNPRSASTTKWYNAAIPAFYNGTLQGGVTLSAGSTDYEVGAGEARSFKLGNTDLGDVLSLKDGGSSSPSGVDGLHLMFDTATKTSKISSEKNGDTNRALNFNASAYDFLSGNVKVVKLGVGMTPVEVLDLKAASGDTRIRLDAVSGSDTEIKFYNAGAAQYTIGHDDATDNFVIGGANVDAPLVSISKTGNLLVGTTNSGLSSSSSSTGINLIPNGASALVRDGGSVLYINRLTSDGDLVQFRKDGTTVGVIGARGSDVYIESGAVGLRMYESGSAIFPSGSTGISQDGLITLGASNYRFKDAHFSGTVNTAALAVTGDTTLTGALTGTTATFSGNVSLTADDGFVYLNNAGTGNSGVYIRGLLTDDMRCHVPTGKTYHWEVGAADIMSLTTGGALTLTGSLTATSANLAIATPDSTVLSLTVGNSSVTGNNKYQDIDFSHTSFSDTRNINTIRSKMIPGWGGELQFWTMDSADDTLKQRVTIDTAGDTKVHERLGVGAEPSSAYRIYAVTTGAAVCGFESSHSTYGRVVINTTAATADSQLSFMTEGSTKWSIGNNAGDSDKFQIETGGGAFGANTKFTLDASGNCGIGTDSPSNKLVVVNSDTDATTTALLQNSSTGDASLHFNVSGRSYTVGIDNSDDDKFKISRNNGLGTTDRFAIDGEGTQNHYGNRIVNSQTLNDSHRTAEPSLRFDGVDDYVDLGTDLSVWGQAKGTVSVWFKPEQVGGSQDILHIDQSSYTDYWVLRQNSDGTMRVSAEDGNSSTGAIESTTAVEVGKWYHIAVTCAGTGSNEVKLYLNGVEEAEATFSAWTEHLTALQSVWLGKSDWNKFGGEIKDLRWHNRALSSDEVAAAYNGESTPWIYADAGPTDGVAHGATMPHTMWRGYDYNTANGTNYSITGSTITITATGGHWPAAGKRFSITGAGKKYRITAKYTRNNGLARNGFFLAKNGTIIRDFDATSGLITNNGGLYAPANAYGGNDGGSTDGLHYTNNNNSTSLVTLDYILDLSNVSSSTLDCNEIIFYLGSESGTSSPYISFDETTVIVSEIGEVAAYTPRSINDKWYDETSNANHGTIAGATSVNRTDQLGKQVIKGSSYLTATTRFADTSGSLQIGGNSNTCGRIDFTDNSTTEFSIDNKYNSASSKTSFGMRTSGTRLPVLELTGDGAVKATNAGGALQQVARVWKQDFTLATTETYEVITHNLNTANIVVSVRTNPSANDTGEMVEVAVKTGDNSNNTPLNKCTLTFASAPAANTNYTATIIG
jgi:hypothetical protein